MARPLKQTVDFFSHDCKHGKTIFILEQRFGNDGYAFWYKLLELLGDSQGHKYDCSNPSDWQYLLAYTKVDEKKALDILESLISLDKIDKSLWDKKILWCQNFVNRLEDVYEKRNTPLPLKPTTNPEPPISDNINSVSDNINSVSTTLSNINPISDSDNRQSRVEYSKVENSKEDILSVFDFWNSKNIISHKNLNGSESAISTSLKSYSLEDIKQSISNYAEILQNQDLYFWSYKWTLKDFLKRGIEKFLDGDIAKNNYLRSKKEGKKNANEVVNIKWSG